MDGGGQAVVGVIGQADGLLRGVEGGHSQDRPEDLLASQAAVGVYAREHGGFHEPAATLLAGLVAAHRTGRTRLVGIGDVAQHLLQMGLLDHGTHGRFGHQRVADHPVAAALGNAFQQIILDRPLDDESGVGAAVLPAVPEDALADPSGRAVQIVGIGHDDDRTLAATFQQDLLEVGVGRVAQAVTTHLRGASERRAVHVHV